MSATAGLRLVMSPAPEGDAGVELWDAIRILASRLLRAHPEPGLACFRTSPLTSGSDSERRTDVDMDESCRIEVRRLHGFFVEWFNDARQHSDEEFAYVEGVLHPDFSMVLPSGVTIDRTTALEQIRAAHGSATGARDVDIEIVDHSTLAVTQDAALVSYEERQFSGGVVQNSRISTAYFVRAMDAPHGVQWYRLHETLLAEG